MKNRRSLMWSAALLCLAVASPGWAACPANPLPQATSGYGANGSYTSTRVSFTNPRNVLQKVYVYSPVGGTPAPTVFFSHAYGARDPAGYGATIAHLNSRGYTVVFPQYPTTGAPPAKYEVLWTGFEEAVSRYPDLISTDKVAFFGHSFGGGATPRMMINALANGWGSSGKAMFIMAPWYSIDLSNTDLATFNPDVKLNMMVYDDDVTNDHEMGIDVFKQIAIPASGKSFFKVFSDTEDNCTLAADHVLPLEQNNGELDGLDYWNWYHMDALLDFTFNGNLTAKNIALGNGSSAQTYWGTWWTGTPYTPAQISTNPVATDNAYQFSCESSDNPRYVADPSACSYPSNY